MSATLADPGWRGRSRRSCGSRTFVQDAVLCPSIVFLAFVAYWPAMRGSLLWDDNAHVTRADLQCHTAVADLVRFGRNATILSAAAHRLLARTPRLGRCSPGLPRAEHRFACPFPHVWWSLSGGWRCRALLAGKLFCSPCTRFAVEAVAWISEQKACSRGFLSRQHARVFTFRPDAPKVPLPPRAESVFACPDVQDGHRGAACNSADCLLVAARRDRMAPRQ